jgi:hypothetical protein
VLNARSVLALLILTGAALAACSGSFGSGTSAPGGLLPSGPLGGIPPTASPTPNSASDIVTYGDSTAFQPLPQVAGYGGAIAFEVPSPRPSGFQAIPVGVTLTVASPTDAPDLNLATPGKKGTKRQRPARPLVYITLLATRDITLATYPRIAVDVPRDVVTVYREEEINLGLYNAGEKDKTYRLAVEEHDTGSPPPLPSPGRTAPPAPTPIPVTVGSPGVSTSVTASPPPGFPAGALTPPPFPNGSPLPGASGPPGSSPSPLVSPTLPPQRIAFAATAASLKLTANKSVVFAVYALPVASPSPAASGSPAASASGSPAASASGSPAPAASGATTGASAAVTAATASATATASAAPSPTGT